MSILHELSELSTPTGSIAPTTFHRFPHLNAHGRRARAPRRVGRRYRCWSSPPGVSSSLSQLPHVVRPSSLFFLHITATHMALSTTDSTHTLDMEKRVAGNHVDEVDDYSIDPAAEARLVRKLDLRLLPLLALAYMLSTCPSPTHSTPPYFTADLLSSPSAYFDVSDLGRTLSRSRRVSDDCSTSLTPQSFHSVPLLAMHELQASPRTWDSRSSTSTSELAFSESNKAEPGLAGPSDLRRS